MRSVSGFDSGRCAHDVYRVSLRPHMHDAGGDGADRDRRHRAVVELARHVQVLEADELRVLARIAARLVAGQAAYGVLDLANDRRDFAGKEAREELEDLLVYVACGWLKAEAKGGAQ